MRLQCGWKNRYNGEVIKMKKIYLLFLLFSLLLIISGCTSNNNSAQSNQLREDSSLDVSDPLEGFWMDEQGNTLTFIGNGAVLWYGENYTYTIYDENKVLIQNIGKEIGNYRFTIKNEELILRNLHYPIEIIFYGNEKQQETIIDALLEAERKEIEESEKAEQEYIDRLIKDETDAEIAMLEGLCSDLEVKILENKDDSKKAFYQDVLEMNQGRLRILKTENIEKINKDSFELASAIVETLVLSEINNSDNLFFLDNGLQYIDNTDNGFAFVGYMLEVRYDGIDFTPLYGSYAVQLSTFSIYEYDAVCDKWLYLDTLLNYLEI